MSEEQDPEEINLIGEVIEGEYKVVSEIGSGGMGVVYRAESVETGKAFALKVLKTPASGSAAGDNFFQNFKHVLSKLAALKHPNAIRIEAYGVWNNHAYVVTHLSEGKSVAAIVAEQGAMAPQRILSIITQVCIALADAHQRDIIHRDLNPNNILVTTLEDGREHVDVLNFGITEVLSADDDSALSEGGAILGNPKYMSPEQVQGQPLDARTDLYSLGVILYEMLVGVPPFQHESVMHLLMMHAAETPPPMNELRRESNVSQSMERLIMRTLSKDPNERPESPMVLLEEFTAAKNEGKPVIRAPELEDISPIEEEEELSSELFLEGLEEEPPRRSAAPIAVALVLVVLLIFTVGYFLFAFFSTPTEPPSTPEQEETRVEPLEPVAEPTEEPIEEQWGLSEESTEVEPEEAIEIPEEEPLALEPEQTPLPSPKEEPLEEEPIFEEEPEEILQEQEEEAVEPTVVPEKVEETPAAIIQPEPEPSVPIVEQLEQGWYVQVTAKEESEEAESLIKSISENGFPAHLQSAVVNKILYHRVLVGPYQELPKAKNVKKQLMKLPVVDEVPFIKKVQ